MVEFEDQWIQHDLPDRALACGAGLGGCLMIPIWCAVDEVRHIVREIRVGLMPSTILGGSAQITLARANQNLRPMWKTKEEDEEESSLLMYVRKRPECTLRKVITAYDSADGHVRATVPGGEPEPLSN